jgi:HAD superfamily hydrolase (TIGR01662 family)
MNFPFKAIGFDWAYTLVDLGKEDDRKPLQKVFSFLSYKNISLPGFEEFLDKSRKIFRPMIENSRTTNQEAHFEVALQKLMNHFVIPLNEDISLDKLLEVYYLEVYSERKVYPEVVSVLSSFKNMGVRMGIVSNTTNPVFMKEKEMQATGLKPFFEFAIYSSGTPYRKPHPSIFESAMIHLDMNSAEILFVGDNISMDVVGAQGVGMKSAWLNRDKKKLPAGINPDYELHSLEDLLRIDLAIL